VYQEIFPAAWSGKVQIFLVPTSDVKAQLGIGYSNCDIFTHLKNEHTNIILATYMYQNNAAWLTDQFLMVQGLPCGVNSSASDWEIPWYWTWSFVVMFMEAQHSIPLDIDAILV